jgi:hypothetical protein
MENRRWFAVTLVVVSLLILSCAKAYHPYVPETQVPKMVYVNGDVENLRTIAGRLYDKVVYVQVTTRKEIAATGKLVQIGEDDIVISPGYYYTNQAGTATKVDVEKIIPKKDILVLTLY